MGVVPKGLPFVKLHQKQRKPQNYLLQSNPSFPLHQTTTSLVFSHGKGIMEGGNYTQLCSHPIHALLILCDGWSPVPGHWIASPVLRGREQLSWLWDMGEYLAVQDLYGWQI